MSCFSPLFIIIIIIKQQSSTRREFLILNEMLKLRVKIINNNVFDKTKSASLVISASVAD